MAGEKRATVKSLSEELEKMKEQVKGMADLRQKINELEEIIIKLVNDRKVNSNEENILRESHECRKCDETFSTKKSLKQHIAESHRFRIKCKLCEQLFSKRCELEVHIQYEHEAAEIFQCEDCDKTFVLKWRLTKHRKNHTSTEIKKCHYFNNNIACPFDELGCMFAHELSLMCKFDQKCTANLCQNRHSNIDNHKKDIQNIEDEVNEVEENENDDTSDEDQVGCHVCCCTFLDQAELDYHLKVDHIN